MAACSSGGESSSTSDTSSSQPNNGGAPPSGGGQNNTGPGGPPNTSSSSSSSAGSGALPPPPPPTMVVTPEALDVNGTSRSFTLATPSTYVATTSYALILALHGDGGTGSDMQQTLHFEDASGQSALVAYPSGLDKRWDLYHPSASNPDVAFITKLVESLRARFTIDAARVFGIGMSSGAFMVNQLACRNSALFRGIAPHSGGAPSEPQDPNASTWGNGFVKCVGQTTGPAVIVLHGKADTMIPLGSGEHTTDYWATVNGCAETRTGATPPPCARQDSCPSSQPVVFCPIDNLGHQLWPDAAKTAWGFFASL